MEQDGLSISWKHLPWKKFQRKSFRLQCKIYEAKCCDSSKNVKRLQKLLIRSKSIYYLAVKKVADYYCHRGLFLSSKIKLNLAHEIHSKINKFKYLSSGSYVKKSSVDMEILTIRIVSSILEFLIEPFFLHFFHKSMKPNSLDSQFFLSKRLCSLLSSKFRKGSLNYIKSKSFLLVLKLFLKQKILGLVKRDFHFNLGFYTGFSSTVRSIFSFLNNQSADSSFFRTSRRV